MDASNIKIENTGAISLDPGEINQTPKKSAEKKLKDIILMTKFLIKLDTRKIKKAEINI